MKNNREQAAPVAVDIRQISHSFGALEVLKPSSIQISQGSFVTILGPSGCGKSTLLSIVSGLLSQTAGQYSLSGRSMIVFQEDGLLPWRTVFKNIELGMEYRKIPRLKRRRESLALLDRVGLSGFGHRYPAELSGGMRQRASIARALAVDPDILLLDEPFGALDALTRIKMQNDLLRLWEGSGKTVLMVTHDIDEAIKLSDRILVFSDRPGMIVGDEELFGDRALRMSGQEYDKLRQRLMGLLEPSVIGKTG